MVNFPEEIMLDICVRLPVKTIGRFRCVNKTWNKLLNDCEFVQNHLDRATEMNRLTLMLYSWELKNHQEDIHTIDYDPSAPTCTGCVQKKLPFVVKRHYSCGLQFHGYCNGLVCLSPYNMNIIIYLWNPATNEYKQMPKTPPSDRHDYSIEHIQCGFGYDYENEEFKVVCLTKYASYSGRQVKRSEVHLYALGSYNWKKLESIPYTVYGQPDVAQVPVNGVIHWIAYRRKNKVILSFNFEKEIFQEIPWPKLLNEDKFEASLCVLGGSLCIWHFNPDIGVEVWVLKERQGRKSWNKLFTVDLKKHFGSVVDFLPLQSLQNGEFLFGLDTDVGFHVYQYDPKHETSRLLFVYEDKVYSSSTTVYVESLVSLNSGSYVDDIDNVVDADSDAEFEVLYDEDGSTYCEQKIIKRV